MKKIILLFAAMMAFTFVNAQEVSKSQKMDAEGRATSITQKMAKVLSLTDAQKTKAHQINLESIKLMDLNQEKAANNPNVLEQEKQRITAKWDTEMGGVLTADQMTVWKKHQANEKAKSTK